MKKGTSTPILILAFNRPHLTKELLNRLNEDEISELYVSIDGPRSESDIEKATEIMALIENFSHKLPVNVRLGKSNLGCRLGVIAGLDWFFSQVQGGLVLEDDCHPQDGLLKFITANNERGTQEKIGMISAHNPFREVATENYLSRFIFIHGWYMKSCVWAELRTEIFLVTTPKIFGLRGSCGGIPESVFWWSAYIRARIGLHDTWDSLLYRAFRQRGYLCLVPKVNMIENMGFGAEATHTSNPEGSIFLEDGPELALGLQCPDLLDDIISRRHFKIKSHHMVTPFVRVLLDFIRVRVFPDFEKQIQGAQVSFYTLNKFQP